MSLISLAQKSVVLDTQDSPQVRLKSVPVSAVKLQDTFWNGRQTLNRKVMLPSQYDWCARTGRLDNFRRAAGQLDGPFEGIFFNDSDVYKWLEAAAWSLAWEADPKLEALVDETIALVAAAQQPDGYLNTYFMGPRAGQRWTNFDLHEMYCAGHLFQAAVAHHRVTGKTSLLDVALRFADHICQRFGDEAQGKQFGVDGHPEVEMGLVELYRVTHDPKYIQQAQYFIDVRGQGRLGLAFGQHSSAYHQDRVPFRQMTRLEGHSVRAAYLNCGVADLYAETGETALRSALEQMWASLVARQMYVTGGLGSRYEIEGFGQDYELPNGRAHTETCASIASFMWNWRMLVLDGQGHYADLMEQVLYNGILPGVSLDGESYYYQNPLSDDGSHRREHWFTVACCPANLSRLLASLPGYLYSVTGEGLWVHLFASSRVEVELPGGQPVSLTQQTEYPWSGEVRLTVETAGSFGLYLRLPGWAGNGSGNGYSLRVNGEPVTGEVTPGNYLLLHRDWQPGDEVRLDFPMDVREVECHPLVTENLGKVALRRGPLLYCLEAADQGGEDVRLFSLSAAAAFKADYRPDLLGGVMALQTSGWKRLLEEKWAQNLYQVSTPGQKPALQPVEITAVPYYAWANRAPGAMVVWIGKEAPKS
jgi:DUF1680 family protein